MSSRASQLTATSIARPRGSSSRSRGGRWRGTVLLVVVLLLVPWGPAQAGADAGFTLDAELQLSTSLQSAVIDPAGRYAYVGENRDQITKVDLATFTVVDSLPLFAGEGTLYTAVIDPAGEFAYFGQITSTIVKVDLSDFTVAARMTRPPSRWMRA